MRTHTTSPLPAMLMLGFSGCVCATLCSLLSSPYAGVLGVVGSVCGSLRSPVFPISSLIPSPQFHTGGRRFCTTSPCELQSRSSGVERRCRGECQQWRNILLQLGLPPYQ